MSLFHVELLFFPNAGWHKMDRPSHSEANTVFQNKFPAVSHHTYFGSPFFLSKLLILLSTLYTFVQVTDQKKSFFHRKTSRFCSILHTVSYSKVNIFSICVRGVEVARCSMIVKNLLTSYSELLLVNCSVI